MVPLLALQQLYDGCIGNEVTRIKWVKGLNEPAAKQIRCHIRHKAAAESDINSITSQIARCMGPICGPPGSCRPPLLTPWTLLSGIYNHYTSKHITCKWKDNLGVNPDSMIMWPSWGPPGADRTQVGPMLAPWILLSGESCGLLSMVYIYDGIMTKFFHKTNTLLNSQVATNLICLCAIRVHVQ